MPLVQTLLDHLRLHVDQHCLRADLVFVRRPLEVGVDDLFPGEIAASFILAGRDVLGQLVEEGLPDLISALSNLYS